MTFSELKETLLTNSNQVELCEDFHNAYTATNYQELIESGLPIANWLYNNKIVTDLLLAEFPNSDLANNGIYIIGTVTISNPLQTIYVIGANVTITVDDSNKANIILLNGTLIVNASASAYVELKAFNNSICEINSNNAVVDAEFKDEAQLTLETTGLSKLQFIMRGNSTATALLKDDTQCVSFGYHHSNFNYTLENNATIKVNQFNRSKIETTPL